MRNIYDSEFKVMIVELLNTVRSTREVSEKYGVESSTVKKCQESLTRKEEIFKEAGVIS